MGEQTPGTGMESLIIVDTDIFIDHFRGIQAATSYLQSIPVSLRATTDVNAMELFRGTSNRHELEMITQFLNRNSFIRLPIIATASRRAVELLKQYSLSHGLSMPDALIAAVVLDLGASLITGNLRHFRFIPELRIIEVPYRQR